MIAASEAICFLFDVPSDIRQSTHQDKPPPSPYSLSLWMFLQVPSCRR